MEPLWSPVVATAGNRSQIGKPQKPQKQAIKLAPIESTEAGELPREVRELVDLTPPELVHAVVTEEGSVGSDEVQALVDRTPFLREGYALLGRTP
jgi:translation initiation factor 2B subunit (eIF-2B alpha/beta/delta family)